MFPFKTFPAAFLLLGLLSCSILAASASSIIEDLGGGEIAAGRLLNGDTKPVAGRFAARQGVSLNSARAAWNLPGNKPVMIEFWLRPWSWNPYSSQSVEVAQITLDNGERLSVRKSPREATLNLYISEQIVSSMPIYAWEEDVARGNDQQVRATAWHQIAIELNAQTVAWAVDGFAGKVAAGTLQPWEKGQLILGSPEEQTFYADLVLRAGTSMARTAESLRRQFRLSYSRTPDLQPSLVTVPFLSNAPDDTTALRQWVRENGTRLVGFTSIKQNRLLGEPLAGYIAYDGKQICLLMDTPFQGELDATRIGRKDGPLWAQESYEIFFYPPMTGVPDYIQLIGNPLGDQTDLRVGSVGWSGQWDWLTTQKKNNWSGLLIAPFHGLDLPNPGEAAVWTGNIFNTKANAVWSWTGSAYNDTSTFGTMRFSRLAPVIRPENPLIERQTLTIPVEIRSQNQSGQFRLKLEAYAEDGIFPITQTEKTLTIAAHQKGQTALELPLGDHEKGLVAFSVYEGDQLLYAKSFHLPVEAPQIRTGLSVSEKTPEKNATKSTFTSDPKRITELSPQIIGETVREARLWQENQLGYTDRTPAPWTPVKTSNDRVNVWNRRYDFYQSLFPQQIASNGKNLLAAPIQLQLRQGKRALTFSQKQTSATLQENDTSVTITAAQTQENVTATVTSTVEFDGLTKITLELQSDNAKTYDGLSLEIPLDAALAKLFHYSASYSGHPPNTDSGAVPAEGFTLDKLREIVWLGSHREGLTWFTEGTENWPLWDEKGIIVLEKERAGKRILRIKLADKPFRLDQPLKIVFGLQATPTRPRPDNFRGLADKSSAYFPWYRGDGHYIPWTMYPELPREQVHQYRQQGREVMPVSSLRYYGKYDFAENDFYKLPDSQAGIIRPEVYLWGSLWKMSSAKESVQPDFPAQQMAAGDWRGKKFRPNDLVNFCPNSSFQDYYLWKLQQAIEQTDLGALYLDQPLVRCANHAHGCGYKNYRGEWTASVPIFSMHQMVKRIYQLFYEKHGTALIRWHSSNQLIIPALSFADVNWDGENYLYGSLKVGEFYSKMLPLDRMQAQHTGLPFGFAADLLPEFGSTPGDIARNAPSPASVRDMMGLFMVHDSTSSSAWTAHPALVGKIQQRRLAYPLEDAATLYYWDQDSRVRVQPETVLSIAHVRPRGDMLLILFNRSDVPAKADITLDLQKLGFSAPEKLTVEDFYAERVLGTTNGTLSLDIAPRDFRMIRVRH